MSTRSRIGILESDGSVTHIYCHSDGYVEHHGPILRDHYKTEDKVRALMVLGDISSLGAELGERHDFDKRLDGVCNVYGRDRGESDTAARQESLEQFRSIYIHAYLFDPMTLSWTFYRDSVTVPLIVAIERAAKGAL